MTVPAVTLTSGTRVPEVGAPAGLSTPDAWTLQLHADDRVCQWSGCHRAPLCAVRDRRSRVVVCAEHWRQLFGSSLDGRSTAIARAADPAYHRWAEHAASAGGCTHPVRLHAETARVDTATGELMPVARPVGDSGVIYKACGNRRATACPSCAETYRADAYQLVLAGLRGGKGVPETVAGHPALFASLTGPSFGLVHSPGREHMVEVLGTLAEDTPKSHRSRTVPIPAFLRDDLADLIVSRRHDEKLFTTAQGRPLRNSNFRHQVFDPAVARAGLAPLTPHDLRDTAASLAVASGASVKAVQRMLGHASAAMTLDVYAGLFDDELDDVADRMSAAAQIARGSRRADWLRTGRRPALNDEAAAGA